RHVRRGDQRDGVDVFRPSGTPAASSPFPQLMPWALFLRRFAAGFVARNKLLREKKPEPEGSGCPVSGCPDKTLRMGESACSKRAAQSPCCVMRSVAAAPLDL